MIILRVWRAQPGRYFCISTKSGTGKWKDHFFKKSEFSDITQFLKDNSDKDVYFCPHGFSKPRRLKPYAELPTLLWSDLDEADPRTMKLKPTIAIESSPGRFVGLWVLDSTMNEELNKRLSYHIGADKGGWDLTQVLRVPGTTNYKYTSTPRVKILWGDGPSYTTEEIEKRLPKLKSSSSQNTVSSDAAEVFKKYERKLPHWVRKELISGKPTAGKRSEMVWKLEQTLIEKGLTTDEAFVLIKASPWNKFAGRRNEDEQLMRELSKVVDSHLKASKPVLGEDDEEPRLYFRSMDQVEEENIEWLYYPYMAKGELTILEGDPGLGKSYFMQIVSAYFCDGKELPSVKKMKPVQGRVVYFDMENSAGSVTKKRLVSNGLKRLDNFIQCEEPFSIDDEDFMEVVYDYLEENRPLVVVFDTLNTYLGKADAYKGHEAQQAFGRFREISRRFNCSVVVLRHLTKSTKERALYRGQGSISFAGLARVVMTVGTSPDDPELRVVAVTKMNVARLPRALTYTIQSLPDTAKDQDRSRFVWGEFVDLSADDIVAPPQKVNGHEKEEVMSFLKTALESGSVDGIKIERMAEARSIGRRALLKAADELGVTRRSKGFGKEKKTLWTLPDDETPSDERSRGRAH